MQRKTVRLVLGILLVIAAALASWSWLRPYQWQPDPGARSRVVGVQVTRDHSNYWLVVHLRIKSDERHDLEKPVRLVTSAGRRLEPADTTFSPPDPPISDLWLRFWLEQADLAGDLDLSLNDGTLKIRDAGGRALRIQDSEPKYFTTSRW